MVGGGGARGLGNQCGTHEGTANIHCFHAGIHRSRDALADGSHQLFVPSWTAVKYEDVIGFVCAPAFLLLLLSVFGSSPGCGDLHLHDAFHMPRTQSKFGRLPTLVDAIGWVKEHPLPAFSVRKSPGHRALVAKEPVLLQISRGTSVHREQQTLIQNSSANNSFKRRRRRRRRRRRQQQQPSGVQNINHFLVLNARRDSRILL